MRASTLPPSAGAVQRLQELTGALNHLALKAVRCHTRGVSDAIEANVVAEQKPLSKIQAARLQRREGEIREGKEALASALAKSLVLMRYMGKCACGLMLTEQDKNPKADTYRCPHCGKSGPLAPAE